MQRWNFYKFLNYIHIVYFYSKEISKNFLKFVKPRHFLARFSYDLPRISTSFKKRVAVFAPKCKPQCGRRWIRSDLELCVSTRKPSGGRAHDMQLQSTIAADNALNYLMNERISLHINMRYYLYVIYKYV